MNNSHVIVRLMNSLNELQQEMIRATLAWRAEYRPELITAEDIEPEAEQGKVIPLCSDLTLPHTPLPVFLCPPLFAHVMSCGTSDVRVVSCRSARVRCGHGMKWCGQDVLQWPARQVRPACDLHEAGARYFQRPRHQGLYHHRSRASRTMRVELSS